MENKFIQFEFVFEINDFYKYTIHYIFSNTTTLFL